MSRQAIAAIFDMDGVLVDSYQAHYASWKAVAAEQGRIVTEEEFAATFGRTSREIIAALWSQDRYGDEQVRRMDQRKEAAFRRIVEKDFPAMAGADALLKALAKDGFRLAVGSSGPPENIALVLDRLGATERFQAVVSGMDVTRGKPDPQVFLIAAERLEIPPRQCVVVEDAPAGVAAARAAGMKSVGFASTGRTRAELAQAHLVIDRLGQLSPAVLRRLVAS